MRVITAGESHGNSIVAVLEGIPSGLTLEKGFIENELKRRRSGYGRGPRMSVEKDEFEIVSGVIGGKTIGSPIVISIYNTEWEEWRNKLFECAEPEQSLLPTRPRPGHADYSGMLKYGFENARPVIERSSARSTVAIVAAGAILKQFLREFEIEVRSVVTSVGEKSAKLPEKLHLKDFDSFEKNEFRTFGEITAGTFREEIDKVAAKGTTVGGVVEVWGLGIPPGLGTYITPFERIDSKIAASMMAIPSVKAVEIGKAVEAAGITGDKALDEIYIERGNIKRKTNFAGGIEAGMTNGEAVRVRLYVKPVPTQRKPLRTVDLKNLKETETFYERSDVCVVPAVGVIGEAMLSYVISEEITKKFGADSLEEIKSSFKRYLGRLNWSPQRESRL